MSTRQLASIIAAGTVVAVLPQQLQAQRTQGIGLEVSAGYHFLGGDDFRGIENAFGFETIGSLAWVTGWEAGVGAGFTSHDLAGPGDASADIVDVFGEGRYRFNVPGATIRHPHPFLAGRVGFSRLTLGDGASASQNGFLVGFGGGVEYWLTDEVGFLGAGTMNVRSYGDSDEIRVDRSGTDFRIRAGMKVRFQ